MKQEDYINCLRMLRVADPDSWAHTSKSLSITELVPLALLRGILDGMPEKDAACSLDSIYEKEALNRVLSSGANLHDLTNIIRGELIGFLWYVLHEIDANHTDYPGFNDFGWGLWIEDGSGKPIKRIVGLHEHIDSFEDTTSSRIEV